jgi:7-cyano-7-deazaguanine synthase
MKTILVYSGGLDSTVLLYQARNRGDELRCLGIDYGQRHNRELRAAQSICDGLGIEYRIADLTSIKPMLAGNSQTGEIEVPKGHYTDETMKLTVVPNRNMIMLSIAIGWAVSLKYDMVLYAAHGGDHPIYPDCRLEFIEALQHAAALCDWHHVNIGAPFVEKTKTDLIRLGAELGVPFEKTWSCYEGREIHCGQCGTCVERREAFELAGVNDPTPYEHDLP